MDWRIRDGRRKTFNVPGHAHELTISCYRRFEFLKAERTCNWMIEYLHLNPVRKKLVERARDWRWSSAALFEGGDSPIPVDRIPYDWLADV